MYQTMKLSHIHVIFVYFVGTELLSSCGSASYDWRRTGRRKPVQLSPPKIDNKNAPFKPSLRSKPNAIQPLDIHLEQDDDTGVDFYCHPYRPELDAFDVPSQQLEKGEPIPPAAVKEKVNYVDNKQSLALMIADLRNENALAVDSEYFYLESYFGYTCLLQISTRTEDYIIDALTLRNELEVLNEVFTDPKILKVMQDASEDVIWLQKDLNLYLVNLFDTYLAARELDAEQKNLPFLLKEFAGVDMVKDRTMQRFYDWRTRPLSRKAMWYARNDTHYLLYLQDMMRNKLIDKAEGSTDLLLRVYGNATNVCKTRFKKTLNVNDHLKLMRKHTRQNKTLNHRQMYALRSLYLWRDEIARETDSRLGFVLPNNILMRIVDMMPARQQDLLKCWGSLPVSDIVFANMNQLQQLILEARKQPIKDEAPPPQISTTETPEMSKS